MRVTNDKVYIEDVQIHHETEKALCCIIEGEMLWIPKSVIDEDSEIWKKGQEGQLVVSEWFFAKIGRI